MAKEKEPDASIGHNNTFAGTPGLQDSVSKSQGDQSTFGGQATGDSLTDDGVEIVDLAPRYKIERILGKGGMGEVLLANDTRLDRKVAIKRILSDASRSSTAINRFLTEAKSFAALNHPNIVQIHDYGRSVDGPFLIMEYVDGGNLLDRCRAGVIPFEEAISLACQLCDGLGRAHERGIIHRDIKPANILLTSDGIPKLTDFGLAKVERGDSEMTMAGAILGTLDFMPPEQRRDATQTDARSDLWSLAATLYQMVTGESPKVIRIKKVPLALQDVLDKALEDSKEMRYQSAGDMRLALESCRKTKSLVLPQTQTELGMGECPSCHILNEPHRKFCRECGDPLRCLCLKCKQEIPVWDKVCPECGGKQSELLMARVQELELECNHAVLLLENLEFEAANDLAKRLGNQPDKRFQQFQAWNAEFLKRSEIKRKEEYERLEVLAREAARHEQAFDYKSAIRSLEQVPILLRQTPIPSLPGETATSLLNRVKEKIERTRSLEAHIRQRIANRQVDDLENEVGQFLELIPRHNEMLRLQQQLADRKGKLIAIRDEALAAAKELEKRKDYEGMSQELSRIAPYVITPEITRLKEEVSGSLEKLTTLTSSISNARAGKKYVGLLSLVNEYLAIKPNDAEMLSLQKQLVASEEKNSAAIREIVAKAEGLMQANRFNEALKELNRISIGLPTDEVNELRKTCVSRAAVRRDRLAHFVIIGFVALTILVWILVITMYDQILTYQEAKIPHVDGESTRQRTETVPQAAAESDAQKQSDTQKQAEAINKQILESSPIRNSIGIELKQLPPGTFVMGSGYNESPYEVTLTKSFYIGVHEVTQEQYEQVMGTNPSHFRGARNPVDSISWNDAVEFCERLSALPEERAAGRIYRLPTEAEWEYACRANSTTGYCFGDDDLRLGEYAWFVKNSGSRTHPVGQKTPNAWGLYDMHGSVWEWCNDKYSAYPEGVISDPSGAKMGENRVSRGGSWSHHAANCRSAFRSWSSPSVRLDVDGFRVALSLPETPK